MEILEQSPVVGIVIVALAGCLLLAVIELVKLIRSSSSDAETVHKVALEVRAGLWGNDKERIERLTAAGYDVKKVQAEVNKILENEKLLKNE